MSHLNKIIKWNEIKNSSKEEGLPARSDIWTEDPKAEPKQPTQAGSSKNTFTIIALFPHLTLKPANHKGLDFNLLKLRGNGETKKRCPCLFVRFNPNEAWFRWRCGP